MNDLGQRKCGEAHDKNLARQIADKRAAELRGAGTWPKARSTWLGGHERGAVSALAYRVGGETRVFAALKRRLRSGYESADSRSKGRPLGRTRGAANDVEADDRV
ncbi:MAG: hypothetical protein SangKO_077150 [Sandaracinaceae bacterium]